MHLGTTDDVRTERAESLLAVQERERGRIALHLHDVLGQDLALLALELRQLEKTESACPRLRRRLKRLADGAGRMVEEVRGLSHELHPAKLHVLGLRAALESLCWDLGRYRRLVVDTEISPRVDGEVSSALASGVYRVAQEALNNVARHARIGRAKLSLQVADESLHLRIEDSGIGFEPSSVQFGLGILSMRERASLMRGTLRVDSADAEGTCVELTVPATSRS